LDRFNTETGKITVANLLTGSTDPDLDPVSFVSANGPSAQGAMITTVGDEVIYTAASPTAIIGNDTFTYTVRDPAGLTATETVTVHLVNRPPVAVADTVTRAAGQPLTIPSASLLANDSDPDGDVISIATVSITSQQGVPVALNGTDITYTPTGIVTGDDTFTYNLRDAQGLVVSGTVTVHTNAPASAAVLSVANRVGGGAALALKGVAFTRYVISVSTDLVNWTALTTVTTDANGNATAEDSTAPADGAGRFYRTDSN
jgi:hypothetical protein